MYSLTKHTNPKHQFIQVIKFPRLPTSTKTQNVNQRGFPPQINTTEASHLVKTQRDFPSQQKHKKKQRLSALAQFNHLYPQVRKFGSEGFLVLHFKL
jgi:hypothetical protein